MVYRCIGTKKSGRVKKYPKADLHNHFVLGGNRRFIYQETRKKIEPLANPLSSMDEMNQWSQNILVKTLIALR